MAETMRNILLWASAIVTAAFGVALLAVPAQLNEFYGGTTNDSLIGVSRLFGGVTLGFMVLAAGATRVENVDARRVIDAAFLTGWALIAVISVWNYYTIEAVETTSTLTALWASVALYVAFAAGFAYELFGPDMRSTTRRARPAS